MKQPFLFFFSFIPLIPFFFVLRDFFIFHFLLIYSSWAHCCRYSGRVSRLLRELADDGDNDNDDTSTLSSRAFAKPPGYIPRPVRLYAQLLFITDPSSTYLLSFMHQDETSRSSRDTIRRIAAAEFTRITNRWYFIEEPRGNFYPLLKF